MSAIIVALANDYAIGRDGDIPWRLPKDFQYFKSLTTGRIVVMGRKTWESLPKKPLPDRTNVIISSTINPSDVPKDVLIFSSLDAFNEYAKNKQISTHDIFYIGGSAIFKDAIEIVDTLYLTHVDIEVPDADVRFPDFNKSDWIVSNDHIFDVSTAIVAAKAYKYDRKSMNDNV